MPDVKPSALTLSELISMLERCDPNYRPRLGFRNPHSYRGYYECLAFEPILDCSVTVGEMLEDAKSAIGQTFQGYKGGDFKMNKFTACYFASYGNCGEEIGRLQFATMLSETE